MTSKAPKEYAEITIPVPWGHLSGRWYGDQSVRPILALHGWLDNCGTFARLAPLLTPYASILCVDLPGHGHASHLPLGIPYHLMDYVRVVYFLMKTYNWPKVSLMGHSMGGNVSFHFASLHPTKVDMVIALDIVKAFYVPPKYAPAKVKSFVEGGLLENERLLNRSPFNEPPTYSFDECIRLLHEGSQYSVDMENCKYILERNITKSQKYPDKYYFSRDRRVTYLVETNPEPELYEEMIKRIGNERIPYCLLKGGATNNLAAAQTQPTEFMLKYNPCFECHVVPDATHHLHLNNPLEVAEHIIPFLKRYRTCENIAAERDNRVYDKAKL